jgi:hypothetical protein
MKSFANHLEDIRAGGLPTVGVKAKRLIEARFRSIYQPTYKRYVAKKIANSMINAVKSKTQAYIVFDHSCSALVYGEVFLVLMLARFFLIHGLKVSFLIVDGEYRKDFQEKPNVFNRAQQFLAEQVELASFISGDYKNNFLCRKISWEEAEPELMQVGCDKSVYILQQDWVMQRLPVYDYAFNTLNYLGASLSEDLIKKFLLHADELERSWNNLNKGGSFPTQPYVALHVRYNPDWRPTANASPGLFINIIKALSSNYPDMDIIVISDQTGCDYFKKVAEDNSLDCLFSKDLELPKSFISDILLVLGSKKYFQINGGGLGAIPILSSVPYTIIVPTIHEFMFSKDKLVPWQTSGQVFKNLFYTGDDAKILDDCI